MKRHAQTGLTLVVSLIMLIVLTLLVVSAIRFGNINLRIANNAQVEAEASAATHVAIEKMVEEIVITDKIDSLAAMPGMIISTGGKTYAVDVAKPTCVLSTNVVTTDLNPASVADQACYGDRSKDPIFDDVTGEQKPQPTDCKNQTWDVSATLNDPSTGARMTMLQGISLRVSNKVQCPA